MHQYEFVFILRPTLTKKEQENLVDKISKLCSSLKGKVVKKEPWGKKTLAYPIKKFKEGFYVKLDLSLPEEKVAEWKGKIKLEDKIIRYLLIKKED